MNKSKGKAVGKRASGPIVTVTNQTLSAPPQIQGPHLQYWNGSLNVRGRAQGLVGHSHNRSACPLPDCFTLPDLFISSFISLSLVR